MLEKPESLKLEGLGSVRSSKGRRLTRIKPGFYQPPKGTIFVPGIQWLCLVVIGLSTPPVLAAMQWWTSCILSILDNTPRIRKIPPRKSSVALVVYVFAKICNVGFQKL